MDILFTSKRDEVNIKKELWNRQETLDTEEKVG